MVSKINKSLPSISYQEQIPEHSEIRLLETVNVFKEESFEEALTRKIEQTPISLRINLMKKDTKDSCSEEIERVPEKSKKSEPQVEQNVEKVRFLSKKLNHKENVYFL